MPPDLPHSRPLPPALDGLPLDHVGVAVPSLADAARPFELLGLVAEGDDLHVPGQGVMVRVLRAGAVLLELLAPTSDASPVARFLAKRGPGLHHLAFRVDALTETVARLRAEGAPLLDAEPRPGIHGTRVVFLHPSFAGGVLVELVEHPGER